MTDNRDRQRDHWQAIAEQLGLAADSREKTAEPEPRAAAPRAEEPPVAEPPPRPAEVEPPPADDLVLDEGHLAPIETLDEPSAGEVAEVNQAESSAEDRPRPHGSRRGSRRGKRRRGGKPS